MSAPSLEQRALALFDEFVELEPADCARRLQALRAQDPALHAELAAMLAMDRIGDAALDRHPASLLAAALPDDDHEDDALLGRRIGPWRIVGIVGRGGMGAVYRGERDDGGFQQQAAIKLIRLGLDHPDLRRRFLRERQILARLRHPNIATLLDGGVTDLGAPYFAMELIEGAPIDRWCDERALDLRARVRLLLQVCGAVQHAHQNLTVHRDLKPGNILVAGEGQAKLLDFGIAKLLESDADAATRDRPLTPEFAAPEQLRGDAVTTATDVYALGLVTCALLAGRTPQRGDAREAESLARVAERIGAAQAQARGLTPRQLAAALRGDMAAIVHRCLEPDPARRYASAEALAADLRAWLDGMPVAARRAGRGYALRKFAARHRWSVAAGCVAMLGICAALGVALWQAREAREQAQLALQAQRRSEAALKRSNATSRLLFDLFSIGGGARPHDRLPSTEEVLEDAIRQVPLRFKNDPRTQADFLAELRDAFALRGRASVDLAARVLRLREAERRQQPVAYAIAQGKLAHSLSMDGRDREAAPLFAAATASLQHLAPDSLALANLYSDRRMFDRRTQGRPVALRDADRAWSILSRHPDAPAEDKFQALYELTLAHSEGQDLALALAYAEQAAALGAATFGRDDLDVAMAEILRARVLEKLGRYGEAETAWKRVAERYGRQGGKPNVYALTAWTALEKLYTLQGRYAEALQARDAADGLRTTAADAEMSDFSKIRGQVERSKILIAMGRYDDADALLREAFAGFGRFEQRMPSEPGLLLLALEQRIRLRCLRTSSDAQSDLKRGFEIVGPRPLPRAAASLHGLAGLCALQAGDAERAVAQLDRSLAIALPQGEDPHVSERLLWRGRAFAALGRPTQAQADWREARRKLQALNLSAHPLMKALDAALGPG
ncbi:serine/threonine protein kinase [Luteimonas gilva]|uniref:Serine/threonine protein kinase n=1 Tax=Luteimonas gilva TaxID=2572684 RepID=A0A4U5JJF1_9GAMM|nr:serine/threonine-protein kinase [Luteimonas gilva]TKR29484.1 serine/threonine protein kinase [Luteimonas gilva]